MKASIPTAFSYIRFSTPEQRKGDSLRRQTEAASQWCQRNNVRLDESMTLHDLGKSAYLGEHRRNADRYALAAFLKLAESGRVPHGSFLVVENLDRLTREHLRAAVGLFMSILDQGISIVTTAPERVFRHDSNDMTDVIIAVIELARGHGESERKSELIGSAWQEKRKCLREGKGQPKDGPVKGRAFLSHALPAWIEERKGQLALIPERAAVVRQIYRLAASGYGATAITKKLMADKVAPFGQHAVSEGRKRSARSGKWLRVYVNKILRTRAVLGEFQPCGPDRKPDGPALPNYFPAVVSETEWHAARAAIADRRRQAVKPPLSDETKAQIRQMHEAGKRVSEIAHELHISREQVCRHRGKGRKSKLKRGSAGGKVNVFSELLVNAIDGGSYYAATRPSGKRLLVNTASGEVGAKSRAFSYEAFEDSILDRLKELDPHSILNGDHEPDESIVLAHQLEELDAEIAGIVAELNKGNIASLAAALRTREDRKTELTKQLKDAQQRAANPLSASWGECQSLVGILATSPDPEDTRLRLRGAIRRIVESIHFLVVPRGRTRLVVAQIWFTGGKRHRDYLILHIPELANQTMRREAMTKVEDFADTIGESDIDLRKRADAKIVEKLLAAVDVNALAKKMRI